MSVKEDKKEPVATLAEEVKNLFEGADVSDDLQDKISTILETVIASKVSEQETVLQEQFDTKLVEAVDAARTEIDETVNGYLDYVVTEWMETNKIAVDNGIRTELSEGFLSGIKDLFDQHYVSIPEDKTDAFVEATDKAATLESELDESIKSIAALKAEIEVFERAQVIESIAEGLADTQKEKLASLVETIEFVNKVAFGEKVATVRESYFKKDADAADNKTDLNEDAKPGTGDNMSRYVKALRR